ncbi:nucleoside transporter-domain-containing protein [Polychytrium aggregatum]|uniref:nucleoside transporter-domain-containing protein n=1 Tax=Polychytrium aggregatum TaxID=110093 RepID=UPI0022FF0961|nr:nucleoside transporter-domain-containing protein [Polychytrium aggregatum]KAI9205387.1 nucleoside transporter-domain-containing protein [Polychytrium aggregatum]
MASTAAQALCVCGCRPPFSLVRRIVAALALNATIFALCALLSSTPPSLVPPAPYFAVLITLVVATGLSCGILENGVLQLVSCFPAVYIQAVVNGENLAGVLVSIAELASLLYPGNDAAASSAILYFSITTGLSLLCIAATLHLSQQQLFKRYYRLPSPAAPASSTLPVAGLPTDGSAGVVSLQRTTGYGSLTNSGSPSQPTGPSTNLPIIEEQDSFESGPFGNEQQARQRRNSLLSASPAGSLGTAAVSMILATSPKRSSSSQFAAASPECDVGSIQSPSRPDTSMSRHSDSDGDALSDRRQNSASPGVFRRPELDTIEEQQPLLYQISPVSHCMDGNHQNSTHPSADLAAASPDKAAATVSAVLPKLLVPVSTILCLSIQTLSIFPGIMSSIESSAGDGHLSAIYFIPVTFLLFNIGAWIGTTLPSQPLLMPPPQRYDGYLSIWTAARWLFLPLFLVCNVVLHDAEGNPIPSMFPKLIGHDWIYALLVFGFAVSHGYLISLALMGAPEKVREDEEKRIAGGLMAVMYSAGCFAGTLAGFGLRSVLCGCNPFWDPALS